MSALGGPDRVVSDSRPGPRLVGPPTPASSSAAVWRPTIPTGQSISCPSRAAHLGRSSVCGANRHPERPGSIRVLNRTTGRDRPWAVVAGAENAFLWDLAISPDGTSLLYDRLNFRANLGMLENFR
jgi:hypothetical protein